MTKNEFFEKLNEAVTFKKYLVRTEVSTELFTKLFGLSGDTKGIQVSVKTEHGDVPVVPVDGEEATHVRFVYDYPPADPDWD